MKIITKHAGYLAVLASIIISCGSDGGGNDRSRIKITSETFSREFEDVVGDSIVEESTSDDTDMSNIVLESDGETLSVEITLEDAPSNSSGCSSYNFFVIFKTDITGPLGEEGERTGHAEIIYGVVTGDGESELIGGVMADGGYLYESRDTHSFNYYFNGNKVEFEISVDSPQGVASRNKRHHIFESLVGTSEGSEPIFEEDIVLSKDHPIRFSATCDFRGDRYPDYETGPPEYTTN